MVARGRVVVVVCWSPVWMIFLFLFGEGGVWLVFCEGGGVGGRSKGAVIHFWAGEGGEGGGGVAVEREMDVDEGGPASMVERWAIAPN